MPLGAPLRTARRSLPGRGCRLAAPGSARRRGPPCPSQGLASAYLGCLSPRRRSPGARARDASPPRPRRARATRRLARPMRRRVQHRVLCVRASRGLCLCWPARRRRPQQHTRWRGRRPPRRLAPSRPRLHRSLRAWCCGTWRGTSQREGITKLLNHLTLLIFPATPRPPEPDPAAPADETRSPHSTYHKSA